MNNNKDIKNATQCVQYLLKIEGKDVDYTQIRNIIKDEDLTKVDDLKAIVENDMKKRQLAKEAAVIKPPTRREEIESFMVSNWSILCNNETVKTALINSYCRGRLNKDERDELANDLIKRCSVCETSEVITKQPEPDTQVNTQIKTEKQTELITSLLGNTKEKYNL
jgi:hypothetical protein